jgi:hypothetical protein
MQSTQLVPAISIEQRIFEFRGYRVMVDRDLAELYDVETKQLNRQVERNRARFPSEFMFRLTRKETRELVAQVPRFRALKHSTVRPRVFTEHGIAMLASVLKSERAIRMSILIVKAFVRFRQLLLNQHELADRLRKLEQRIDRHDAELSEIINAIRRLLEAPMPARKPIGFRLSEPAARYRVGSRKK